PGAVGRLPPAHSAQRHSHRVRAVVRRRCEAAHRRGGHHRALLRTRRPPRPQGRVRGQPRPRACVVEVPEMTAVFVANVRTSVEATAVAETADQAARLACEKAMEYLQSVHGDLGYDDPMLVGKYFGDTVIEFEVGTAQFTRRSTLLAP